MSRRCKNWLSTYFDYVEETESPRHFWLWGGLFTIGAALQRKVWMPFRTERIYPNLYVMLVAKPGWCRKGAPLHFARDILKELNIPMGIDSPSKRHFTKKLDSVSRENHFQVNGVPRSQAPLALISTELSSLLAVDPKGMIEVLTDLYDCHDSWDYGTSGAGEDKIKNVCPTCFFGTTPDWMARNLPEEAIGGGFTTRFIILSGTTFYKAVSYPPVPPKALYRDLYLDLAKINQVTGEFVWGEGAFEVYDTWYHTIRDWADSIGDDRLYGNFSRVHVIGIKVAMILHMTYSSTLVIEARDMSRSIKYLHAAFEEAHLAFSSHGRSKTGVETDRIKAQLEVMGAVSFRQLLKLNYRNTDRVELREVLDNLEAMGFIKITTDPATNATLIQWVGGRRKR